MTRFIIRPKHIRTTPRLLKEALNASRTLQYPIISRIHRPSYTRDFFLCYPASELLEDRNDLSTETLSAYQRIREFYTRNKPLQRHILACLGFPVPFTTRSSEALAERTSSHTYIARPLRHSGGHGYRLLRGTPIVNTGRVETLCTTSTNTLDTTESTEETNSWNPAEEYLQELYPKNHEYRVIISRSVPIITLYKRVPPGLSYEQPWNHQQGSSFVTVEDINNNRLRHTNIYGIIEQNREFFKVIDLCGLDVLVNLRHYPNYVITELNLAPSLTIEDNLRKVTEHVNQVLR